VVPVFNAADEVRQCLAALFENGGYDALIVVDDASDAETAELLDREAQRRPFQLIRNKTNLGYTRSVNIGLRAALGHDVVVFLNSDTVTTLGWVARIRAAFAQNPKVGIAGPLSNAASYQSIPEVKGEDGNFVTNALPEGITADDIALAVGRRTPTYPRVPVINGFCFAVRTEVVRKIGLFDEEKFPVGYGEENDLCLRAAKAGWELAVVDDAYVFHAKSASFGAERRQELARQGRNALNGKHGEDAMRNAVQTLERNLELDDARHGAKAAYAAAQTDLIYSGLPLSVAYVLPAKPGGGGVHSIVQEANFLHSRGVKVAVLVPEKELATFLTFYADDGIHPGLFIGYRSLHMVRDQLAPYDAVVATVYRSVALVREIMTIYPEKRVFYYVQDYEPYFHPEGTPDRLEAFESYDLDPRVRFFAKTRWLRDIVFEKHGRRVDVVLPSLDRAVYFPSEPGRKSRVAAMVRPSTPRRNPEATVAFAKALAEAHDGEINLALFGEAPEHAIFDSVRDLPGVTITGRLNRPQVATLFRQSDIFVDLSEYQAFGRASLEAMSSGCTAIVPLRGGSGEFAVDGWNAVMLDTETASVVDDAVAAVARIYGDLESYRAAALETAERYSIETAGRSIYKFFLGEEARLQ
jgi:GT2 family glycosyltransferase/glycosyltransferase involved in cell wall biosynthesis